MTNKMPANSSTPQRSSLILALMISILPMISFVSCAEAAAPFAKGQTPGVSRIMVGHVEVTALNDGSTRLDAVKLLNEPPAETEAALARSHLTNPVETSVNAFLINTGTRLILVDSGAGVYLGPSLGKLETSLRSAGYAPEQVDDILLTHMHRDHIGGLVSHGAMVFKNAIVHADRREADYWLSKSNLAKASPETKMRFEGVIETVGAYVAAGRFKSFDADANILPDVRAVAAPGHTIGHTAYVIESEGQQLWLIGDLINFGAVQLDHPQISSAFDSDGKQASETRAQTMKLVAKDNVTIAAAHLPFPGLGRVKAVGDAWQWLPDSVAQAAH